MIHFYKIYNIYHVFNKLIQSKWNLPVLSDGYSLPTCLYYSLMQGYRWNIEPTVSLKVKEKIFLLVM